MSKVDPNRRAGKDEYSGFCHACIPCSISTQSPIVVVCLEITLSNRAGGRSQKFGGGGIIVVQGCRKILADQKTAEAAPARHIITRQPRFLDLPPSLVVDLSISVTVLFSTLSNLKRGSGATYYFGLIPFRRL